MKIDLSIEQARDFFKNHYCLENKTQGEVTLIIETIEALEDDGFCYNGDLIAFLSDYSSYDDIDSLKNDFASIECEDDDDYDFIEKLRGLTEVYIKHGAYLVRNF